MFKYLTSREQMVEERKKRESLAARQEGTELASSIAFVVLAETGAIDEETATEHTDLFSPWAEGTSYQIGNIRSYNNTLYRCVQAHTSQGGWTPDAVPALWTKIGDPAEEFPEWSQPVGAHDAYHIGDKVSFGGKHWESIIDANVWQPGVYGWQEV